MQVGRPVENPNIFATLNLHELETNFADFFEFSGPALGLVCTGTQRLGAPNSQSTGFLPLLFTMLSYT